jgi:hypothetical protein
VTLGGSLRRCEPLSRSGASVVDLAEGIGGEVVVVPGFDHHCCCCWSPVWAEIAGNRNATEVGDVFRAILLGHLFRAASVMQDWTGIGQGEQFTSDVSRDSIG